MEHQKIINLLNNSTNQLNKLRTKIRVELNDDHACEHMIRTSNKS